MREATKAKKKLSEKAYEGRWVKVKSSNLKRVRYFKEHKILEVEFLGGGVYRYAGVPRIVFTNLLKAKSHGSYFARKIRGGSYKYQKVEDVT